MADLNHIVANISNNTSKIIADTSHSLHQLAEFIFTRCIQPQSEISLRNLIVDHQPFTHSTL